MKNTAIVFLLVFSWPLSAQGQSSRFFTLSNIKARPIAMGGAFTSVADDLASIDVNPAAYFLSENMETRHIHVFLNPISPFIGGLNTDELFPQSDLQGTDFLLSLSLLLKSISFTLNRVQVGLLFGEESLWLPREFINDDVFRTSGFQQNHHHSIVGRLKLAEKVSVGGVASLMFGSIPESPEERVSELGFSYGILLKPERGLSIGVTFFNLPDSLMQHRWPLERFVDESVNIGISYELFTKTLFSVDVRNLGEETNEAVREFHFGLEQIILSQIALRAGYFRRDNDERVFSWGIGLLNGDQLFSRHGEEGDSNYYLNYAFVYEKAVPVSNHWHFLTLGLKI